MTTTTTTTTPRGTRSPFHVIQFHDGHVVRWVGADTQQQAAAIAKRWSRSTDVVSVRAVDRAAA